MTLPSKFQYLLHSQSSSIFNRCHYPCHDCVHVINISLPGITQTTVSIIINSASLAFPATTYLHLFTMLVNSLLLLASSTISKALPQIGSHPWIGSFDLDDVTCTNTTIFVRPEINRGDCTRFELKGDRVGGSWGSQDRQIGFMDVHDSTDCTDTQVTITRNKGEDGFCIPVADLTVGDFAWNSILGR